MRPKKGCSLAKIYYWAGRSLLSLFLYKSVTPPCLYRVSGESLQWKRDQSTQVLKRTLRWDCAFPQMPLLFCFSLHIFWRTCMFNRIKRQLNQNCYNQLSMAELFYFSTCLVIANMSHWQKRAYNHMCICIIYNECCMFSYTAYENNIILDQSVLMNIFILVHLY